MLGGNLIILTTEGCMNFLRAAKNTEDLGQAAFLFMVDKDQEDFALAARLAESVAQAWSQHPGSFSEIFK